MLIQLISKLLYLALSIAPSAQAEILHVVVDPGHGGIDHGAVRGTLREADIALSISQKLAQLLKADTRFRVSLTRQRDETVSLKRRTEIAKNNSADLFISIHANSSEDARAMGMEIYFQNQLPVDEESLYLASRENQEEETDAAKEHTKKQVSAPSASNQTKSDLHRIIEDLQRNYRLHASSELSQIIYAQTQNLQSHRRSSRAIRQAPFFVVSQLNVPSILIEVGFITNKTEGPKLADKAQQNLYAQQIFNSLIEYKELVDKDLSKP